MEEGEKERINLLDLRAHKAEELPYLS